MLTTEEREYYYKRFRNIMYQKGWLARYMLWYRKMPKRSRGAWTAHEEALWFEGFDEASERLDMGAIYREYMDDKAMGLRRAKREQKLKDQEARNMQRDIAAVERLKREHLAKDLRAARRVRPYSPRYSAEQKEAMARAQMEAEDRQIDDDYAAHLAEQARLKGDTV